MSNPQGQGAQGPPQTVQMLKAEDVAKLQHLSEDQRQKYRPVLAGYLNTITNNPPGSQEHQQARAKLQEWSQKLINQERVYRSRMKAQQQAQQQQQQQQSSQPDAQNTQGQQPGSSGGNGQQSPTQPMQAQKIQPPNPGQLGQQRAQGPPNVDPEILKHVQGFAYYLPLGGPQAGTPAGDQKIKEYKSSYMMALSKQSRATQRIKMLENMIKQCQSSGKDIPPEVGPQKQQMQQEYESARDYVDNFRKRQAMLKREHEAQRAQQQQQQPALGQQPPQPQPIQPQRTASQASVVKEEPQIKVEGGSQAQITPQFTNMASGGASQNVTPVTQQQPMRQPPTPHSQQMNQAQPFTQPGQAQQPVRPQINPTQANAHQQQQQQTNSPHPQSATGGGPPVPLSHQAAVNAAQRSYSNTEPPRTATPMQASGGQGNFHAPGSREREQMNNPKMPIPRTLNVTQPTPVAMGPARPTLSGPTNGAPGLMGQPVIPKFPPFQLEGEGDRVLSKRKLDELVRQVTGGAEEALTPEVEEVSLIPQLTYCI